MLPYIAEDGLKWTRFDVEAPYTGRTLDGVMHRGRVAVKIRLDVTCRPPHQRGEATSRSTQPSIKIAEEEISSSTNPDLS